MNRLIISTLAGILMGFSGITASAGDAVTLSQAELGKLFPGSFQAVVNGAVTIKITARGNGTLIGQMTGQEDRGRWSVQSGKLCIVWTISWCSTVGAVWRSSSLMWKVPSNWSCEGRLNC